MIAAFCPSDTGFLTDSGCGSFARHKLRHPALPPSAVRRIRPGVRIWSGVRSAPRNPKQAPSFRPVGPEVPQHPCMGSTGLAQFGLSPHEVTQLDSTHTTHSRLGVGVCPALPDLTDRYYAALCTTLLTGASLRIRTVVRIGYPAGPRVEFQKRAFRSDRAHLEYFGVIERALRALFSLSWSSSEALLWIQTQRPAEDRSSASALPCRTPGATIVRFTRSPKS